MVTYGVLQEQDWNSLSDDEFRRVVRDEFESHYPDEIRYPPRRLYWREQASWFERMARKGWIATNWPARYGGMGLDPSKLLIFFDEQERWGIARFQDQGIRMIGPALFEHGTEEQRQRFLPGILSCEHRYCQGYSEPGSGSDLSSLRTAARRENDEYLVNGSKIWTTMAHDVTHMMLLARTGTEGRSQAGISFFLVELTTPGITVRPILDLAGHEELCEVFLEDVRIPVENRIAGENEGWTVANTVLRSERIHIGSPQLPSYGLASLSKIASACGAWDDEAFRARYAELLLDLDHLKDIYEEFARAFVEDRPIGPDVSLIKILSTELVQRIAECIRETVGVAGAVTGRISTHLDDEIDVLDVFYKALPSTIYGGSNDIQRNIIAKRVLRLPS
jgi:alkylation response protein AidB-like acyl-CoA dehydrogenase